MAIRGKTLTVGYVAWDLTNNSPKSGDAGNHTIKWIKDGVSATASCSPVEISSSACCGEYKLTLTSTETLCDFGTVCGASSSSGVTIIPTRISFESDWGSCSTFSVIFNCAVYGVIRNEILDATLSGHTTVGTVGCALFDSAGDFATVGDMVDAIWDEDNSLHVTSGSTGENLANAATAGTPPTADQIADEVETRTLAAVTSVVNVNEIADATLKRDMSAVTGASSRSLLNAIRFLRNKWFVTGTTLTVTEEDDSTTAWTGDLTTATGANPVRGVDPS